MQPFDPALSRRNYWLMTIEGAVFWLAWAFLDSSTVVSVFLNQTTGSLALAGLATSMKSAVFIISQTVLGFFMYAVNDRAKVMRVISYASRPVLLLMVPALLLGLWGTPAAALFFAVYGAFFLADGVAGLLWTEIMASTVEPNMRGRITGNQQLYGGLCAILGSVLVRNVLSSQLPASHQYAILFGICGLLMVLDAVFLGRIGDAPASQRPPRREIRPRDYLRGLLEMFRESAVFRRVVSARFCHNVVVLLIPMFILFGSQVCGLTEAQSASLVTFSVLGATVGGFIWGRVSHRLGYKAVMRYSCLINIMIMALGFGSFFAAGSVDLFLPICAMVFLGTINNCAWLGYTNHMIDNVGAADRPHYLVLQGVVLFPSVFATYGAGLLAAAVNFGAVFGTGLVIAALGTLLVYFRIP